MVIPPRLVILELKNLRQVSAMKLCASLARSATLKRLLWCEIGVEGDLVRRKGPLPTVHPLPGTPPVQRTFKT